MGYERVLIDILRISLCNRLSY